MGLSDSLKLYQAIQFSIEKWKSATKGIDKSLNQSVVESHCAINIEERFLTRLKHILNKLMAVTVHIDEEIAPPFSDKAWNVTGETDKFAPNLPALLAL